MVKQYGFLINTKDCYGCRTCSMACKSENVTPPGVLWRRVREFNDDSPNAQAFITMSCNHCDDPQCLKVCPADTYTKRADGIVVQDHENVSVARCVSWLAHIMLLFLILLKGKRASVICAQNG